MTDDQNASQGAAEAETVLETKPEVGEAEAAVVEEAEQPEGEKKPDEPSKDDWAVKRIAKITAQRHAAEAEAAALKERVRILEAREPNEPVPHDIEALANERAAQKIRENDFNAACNRTFEDGMKSYPDFQEKLNVINAAVGPLSNDFLEDVMATDAPHEALYRLAQDPGKAEAILAMSPKKRVAELVKLSLAKPAEKSVSKAPPPLKPVTGGRVSDDLSDDLPADEWRARRNRQLGLG